jgi:hypothetical protein
MQKMTLRYWNVRQITSTVFSAFLSGLEKLSCWLMPNQDDGVAFTDALSELK